LPPVPLCFGGRPLGRPVVVLARFLPGAGLGLVTAGKTGGKTGVIDLGATCGRGAGGAISDGAVEAGTAGAGTGVGAGEGDA
jgi:hypothetical protein